MTTLVRATTNVNASDLSYNDPPAIGIGPRQAAVLILLGDRGDGSPDVLLLQRASGLRDHPGEVCFPGGGWESDDTSPVSTAIREAVEETGLDPAGVDPVAVLPRLLIKASGFEVTAVIAHWRSPTPVGAATEESAAVFRLPMSTLAQPEIWRVAQMSKDWQGRVVALPDALIWGYTADLLAAILRMGDWESTHRQ